MLAHGWSRRPPLLDSCLIATTLLLPLIAVVAIGSVWVSSGSGPGETVFFARPGAALLTGHWGAVYDNSGNQGGPFELIPFGVAQLLHTSTSVGWTLFFFVTIAGLVAATLAGVFGSVPDWHGRGRTVAMLVVGAATLLTGVTGHAMDVGHPAEVMAPVMWLLAAAAAKDRRYATAGLLLGLSMGWETWGALGAPVLFCGGRPRLVRIGAATGATAALLYAPFVASGHFAMFSCAWPVQSMTLVHWLAPQLEVFPWTFRLAQAGGAVAAGLAVARLTRSSPHRLWLVPLAVVAVRLLLDPCLYAYYWVAPATLAVTGIPIALRVRQRAMLAVSMLGFLWLGLFRHGIADAVALVGMVATTAVVINVQGGCSSRRIADTADLVALARQYDEVAVG